MASDKPARRETGKRSPGSKVGGASTTERTPSGQERQLVDIDPWAMLLDQLMEVPEESATTPRERPKRK